jgi:hypothetical protein
MMDVVHFLKSAEIPAQGQDDNISVIPDEQQSNTRDLC